MKYLSLFSGIGAFEKALSNLGIDFELIGYSEIDKYASKSYSQIHGVDESLNLGDIRLIDEKALPEMDLITYGFPCQDISKAGLCKGLFDEQGNATRSGLFYDAIRIINHCKPSVAIAENVKNLTSKRFIDDFSAVLSALKECGYNNYFKVLNSKDYGIPQHRERLFIVSIRKDKDDGRFAFPTPTGCNKIMRDLLDDDVDEKYYLSQQMIDYITSTTEWGGSKTAVINKDIASTINTNEGHRRCDYSNYVCDGYPANFDLKTVKKIGNIYGCTGGNFAGNIYDAHGLSPTISTMGGGNRQPMIESKKRIRKITPKEAFRLMGFTDADFEKCTCSNTQLYKQAGNSIVVPVIEGIFKNLMEFKPWED